MINILQQIASLILPVTFLILIPLLIEKEISPELQALVIAVAKLKSKAALILIKSLSVPQANLSDIILLNS
jgi:hypothetical protein